MGNRSRRSGTRRSSQGRRPSGRSAIGEVRKMISHRAVRISDPTAGAPVVDYEQNPWTPYADLADVFTPPTLDAQGNPIKPEQKEWREDPRSVKGWNEVPSGNADQASTDLPL